jgi:hypothetical protein
VEGADSLTFGIVCTFNCNSRLQQSGVRIIINMHYMSRIITGLQQNTDGQVCTMHRFRTVRQVLDDGPVPDAN